MPAASTESDAMPQRPYGRRLATAFVSGSVFVSLAALALDGHGQDMLGLAAGTLFIVAIALPAAAIAALLARRDMAVVLAGQFATMAGVFALRWLA